MPILKRPLHLWFLGLFLFVPAMKSFPSSVSFLFLLSLSSLCLSLSLMFLIPNLFSFQGWCKSFVDARIISENDWDNFISPKISSIFSHMPNMSQHNLTHLTPLTLTEHNLRHENQNKTFQKSTFSQSLQIQKTSVFKLN